MPRKNFYLSDADEEYYQQAKKYAGDSLSSVIVNALKVYVKKMGLSEIVIWVGEHDIVTDSSSGKNVKFNGKLLASGKSLDGSEVYSLYLTGKGKYLLYTQKSDEEFYTRFAKYELYDDFNKVGVLGLPNKMISEAIKNLPEMTCEELDV